MSGSFPFQTPESEYNQEQEGREESGGQQELIAPEAQPAPEQELPPEARGETHGGPLGCCLGATVGMMLFLFFGVIGIGRVTANILTFAIHADAVTDIRIATAIFVTAGALIGGYLGWKIGKRIFREYGPPPPRVGAGAVW